MPTAASSDQKYRSRPYPNGCRSSATLVLRLTATSSSTWFVVSASECTASESMAADPLSRPAIALAIAMPRLAIIATTTVSVLSSSDATRSFLQQPRYAPRVRQAKVLVASNRGPVAFRLDDDGALRI